MVKKNIFWVKYFAFFTEASSALLCIYNKNTCTPKENHHTVETFIQAFKNDSHNENKTRGSVPRNNLTKNELGVFNSLQNGEDTVITKADRVGVVVIVDGNDYINEFNQQL